METWNSRRSTVYSTKGMCASSQPLASAIGVKILQGGGNAADAAVAMAAALNVTEPCSTGIGGDAFALYYEASTQKVHCLQGNGASALAFDLDALRARGIAHDLQPLDPHSGLCVTVPGAAALWDDLVSAHGQLPLAEVLAPAIALADDGFPVHPVTAAAWSSGYLQGAEAHRVLRPKAVQGGQMMRNPDLAETFRTVALKGAREGFYHGRIAEAIVQAAGEYGGLLTMDDLSVHRTSSEAPISTDYKGIRIYQTPPPSHGLAVLLALNIVEEYEKAHAPAAEGRESVENTHVCVEAMRRGFADALQYIGDPLHAQVPLEQLLSAEYSRSRANEIQSAASTAVLPGKLTDMEAYNASLQAYSQGETVYFCVVDAQGNACSMINSNYMHFGTGIMPIGTGFTLQNRGFNFTLIPGHNNCAAGRKRPYHTIIPGLGTKDGELWGVFGNMGGFMQPMGHLQLLRGLVDYQLDPQTAIDAPRWYLQKAGLTQSSADMFTSVLQLEDGFPEDLRKQLRERGHTVQEEAVCGGKRSMFGKAQAILKVGGVLMAGSDPRGDGCAMPMV